MNLRRHFKNFIILFIGFILGIFSMIFIIKHSFKLCYLEEYICDAPYETVVKNFTAIVNENPKWELRKVACSLPKTVDSNRISMFNICNGMYATALLNTPETRGASAFIPCQISIFERDGKCVLARLNMGLIGYLLGGEFKNIFTDRIDIEQRELILPIIGR